MTPRSFTPSLGIRLKYHWLTRALCVIGMLFFLWLTALSLSLGQKISALVFLTFILLSIYTYATTTYTTILTATDITSFRFRRVHHIYWDEISTAATNPSSDSPIGNTCVLTGNGKRFVLDLTPCVGNRRKAKAFLQDQFMQRHISMEALNTLSFKNSNTQVK